MTAPKAVPPRPPKSRSGPAAPDTVTMIVDGDKFPLTPEDLTSKDVAALRRGAGFGLRQLINLAQADPDIDVIAAFVWLSRRSHGEPDLDFDEVVVSYQSTFDVIRDGGEEEPDPET